MKEINTQSQHKFNEKARSQRAVNGLIEEPLRQEIFSLEQMESFGKGLASTHTLRKQRMQDHLLQRLLDNSIILHEARKLLTDSIKRKHQVSLAAEWLIDNFYLIEEHIRYAKTHFNKNYKEDLPQLLAATSVGQARIYDIVVKVISHTDGRIDMEGLSGFMKAYQTVTHLQLAELWAIPFMLRLALIENIRRVSDQIITANANQNRANYWVERMIETAGQDPENLLIVIADIGRSNPSMESAFVIELLQQLRAQGPGLELALYWIEQELSERGLTNAELENAENHKQDANQVSMRNSIGSLRLLGAMEWSDFVENHSIVEQILREDNNGIYGLMDFRTCNNYRNVVAHIAKESKLAEHKVARIAIQLMHENGNENDKAGYTSHVGYYLIGEGVAQTKMRAKMPVTITQKIWKLLQRNSFGVYVTFIFLVSLAVAVYLVLREQSQINNSWILVSMAILSFVSGSHLAVFVVNFFSSLLVKPNLLPRMDFSHEIPPEFGTLIVIPAMLINQEEIESLVQALEVHYLANKNDNLHFGLVTDFTDASQETLPEDQALLNLVQEKIEELNRKYKSAKSDLFFLFHRPRQWNPRDKVWMGYERKRGKLSELNSLLRGSLKERFSLIIGNQSIFPCIKYVITLDDDTQLPPGSAWKLIGTMAHILNRPWYNEKKKRVTKGYGILQPRVEVSMPDRTTSLYARMHGNEEGIDPYTRVSSNIYQDLFAEGSFIGKGIYDVDIYKKVLDERFSENAILSHDLLEGCYLRSGLLSDVQLYEKYPSSFRADMKRYLRWVRGDWQIFHWILPVVPGKTTSWKKNHLSALSRWKIFDNLRRSLIPVALTALIVLGWIALPHSLFSTIIVSGIIIVPLIITSIRDTIRKPKEVILTHHIRNSVHHIADICIKTLFKLSVIPYEACSNLMAIVRTLWRVLITKKKLLEWNLSARKETVNQKTLFAYYSFMWAEPALACFVAIYLAIYTAHSLIIAGAILLLWAIAPSVTWWVSKPLEKQRFKLTDEQNIFLRKLARKTWGFFERFVQPQDNWLPPDNFQEQPVVLIAHRTSPTNIGLYLLANVSAHDFGYITTGQFLERTTNTLSTMKKMERYNDHFYNWYDTQSLNPLLPKYISTVDSGNLASHLLVLRQGMLALPKQKISVQKLFNGLRDTLSVLTDTLDEKGRVLLNPFKMDLEAASNIDLSIRFEINVHADKLLKCFTSIFEKLNHDPESETYWWKQQLHSQLKQVTEYCQIFTPWFLLQSAPQKFSDFVFLNVNSTLAELLKTAHELQAKIDRQKFVNNTLAENEWLELFQTALRKTISKAEDQITAAIHLAQQCQEMADMELDFLYDKSSNLFTVGFNVQENKMDASFYDLLASEVRLCIYVGIAQGKLPEESWFALRRQQTNMHGYPVLLSWSGSMFEYLMPLLVMPTYENTFLDQTYKSLVRCQIIYGQQAGMPWGISESGFNMINANSQYQYRAFGYPGLGMKRGIEEDAVIAPYASALALMVAPEKACKNLELLSENGFEGRYGLYEAIDYTASRLQHGQSSAIVYSFMAHHQGMSLLSLAYLLLDKPMQKLFKSEPQFKAMLLLLQERIPIATTFSAHTTNVADVNYVASGTENRIINTPDTPIPEVQLLSNGRYHVMITNAGTGYSRWKDLAVTRWREDGTSDNWGMFCYIRDFEGETYWSTTYQPTLKKGEKYEATFSLGRADFYVYQNNIETNTAIIISPEDDVEMRRVIITNRSPSRRTIEVTSYAEVVITPPSSDLTPAFSNLFVQTEIIEPRHTIICRRRQRAEEQTPLLFHLMVTDGKEPEHVSFETDRMEFIGRGNTTANPHAINSSGTLSNSQGSVLDPIVSIRYKLTLDPGEIITIDMIIGVSETRENCLGLIDKYHDKNHRDSLFGLAWTHSQIMLSQIKASEADVQLYAHLASSILFINSSFRAAPAILINNHLGQSGLWGYAISGDLPIVLLQIEKTSGIRLAKQLIQAHTYWRLNGLAVDLVIWNKEIISYRQNLQDEIQALIPADIMERKGGGIFIRAADQILDEDKTLFQTVARINISDNGGTLSDQVNRHLIAKLTVPYFVPTKTYSPALIQMPLPKDLVFFNGLGGFSADGSEYVITLDNTKKTPVPWVNVIANPNFGTIISESGSAYTWIENAHELRLTPWNNDPVMDNGGEAFYLRDEESGHFWSTTFLPTGGQSNYITRHGFGYSVFEHIEDGIYSEMLVYIDIESAVKFTSLKIRNQSGKPRKLSATGYVEWVLGDNRMKTGMFIHTEIDPDSGALFAKNPYNTEFSNRAAFFDVDSLKKTFTADRTEFIGRNATLKNPDAMLRQKLSGRVGLALDSCAAIQVPFDIVDGGEHEIIFRLGAAKDSIDAGKLVRQFRGSVAAHDSLERVKQYWKKTIGTLRVETPDIAINIITNGWLTYQTLSSRLWGRSGFYQSGGAFGFRDQLQDVLSLLHAAPQLAREQILLCAAHQFEEGDVQHWWHPPVGRGVRTRISDDFLWLPMVTSLYVLHTGDTGVLDESAPYLEGRPLKPGEESYYDLPQPSANPVKLYDHCVQAIKHGFNYGEHGLPLIGTGDWNDGYNKVGEDGKGESVWMAFFLYDILIQFEKTARLHNDSVFADECIKEAQQLKENIDKHAWDGEWYKRAWFDNGAPLGSSKNEECKIDSIAQSWSVLSGAGDNKRANSAMEAAYKKLVQKDARIIKLLDPPFDKAELNPGYIKGYVPGIRENGGQYTHAAVWMIIAFAKLGDHKRVWELLSMINPINHGKTSEAIAIYKVEPYVLAADVYAGEHAGRGGWTWYTGSAGWLYRLIIESFLGLQQEGNKLKIVPCVPEEWESFRVHYRYRGTVYQIEIVKKKDSDERLITVDGVKQAGREITLIDDGKEHHVQVLLLKDSAVCKGNSTNV